MQLRGQIAFIMTFFGSENSDKKLLKEVLDTNYGDKSQDD